MFVLDNTFYVFTLMNIMRLPKAGIMNFQFPMSNFISSPTVLERMPGQQFKQIVSKYQSWYFKYLGKLKFSLRTALVNLAPFHTQFKLWHPFLNQIWQLLFNSNIFPTILYLKYGVVHPMALEANSKPKIGNFPYLHYSPL